MHAERGLIRAVMEAGASGYILKDDPATLKDLGGVVRSVAAGGVHFSQIARDLYVKYLSTENNDLLTIRQLEALSLCAAYPDSTSSELAQKMSIGNSTVRNLLSAAYLKLGVHTRAAAIAMARELGVIAPNQIEPPK
jgi:DNA-binding NarL/FixJ family response regulator